MAKQTASKQTSVTKTEWTRSAPKDRTKRSAKVADKIDVKNIIKTVRARKDVNYSTGNARVAKTRKSKNSAEKRQTVTTPRVAARRR